MTRWLLVVIALWPVTAWAAPSPTQLAAEILTADQSNYTTTSFAISANTLITFSITGAIGTADPITTPTITCHGLTWVSVGTAESGGAAPRKLFLFRSMSGSASGSATCSYDFSGQTQLRSSYTVQEWSGVNTSGTNGSGAVVSSNIQTDVSTANPATVTMNAYANTNNRPFYTMRVGDATAHSPEAGWTELSDPAGAENMTHSAGWKSASDDTSVAVTNSGTSTHLLLAIEIQVESAQVPRSMHQYRPRRND